MRPDLRREKERLQSCWKGPGRAEPKRAGPGRAGAHLRKTTSRSISGATSTGRGASDSEPAAAAAGEARGGAGKQRSSPPWPGAQLGLR